MCNSFPYYTFRQYPNERHFSPLAGPDRLSRQQRTGEVHPVPEGREPNPASTALRGYGNAVIDGLILGLQQLDRNLNLLVL
ncbi:hypothetical protein [Planctomicrobium sp. SH527]|uniref:hypothetical protein n=1 Tax=Planctomicrobium sp. SH527 TaxID=3448123 RepID=UPI003F5BEF59